MSHQKGKMNVMNAQNISITHRKPPQDSEEVFIKFELEAELMMQLEVFSYFNPVSLPC